MVTLKTFITYLVLLPAVCSEVSAVHLKLKKNGNQGCDFDLTFFQFYVIFCYFLQF